MAMPIGSPPAQKVGRPAPIAMSAVVPSPARFIAHTTRSIASSNTKHRAVTRPMLRSSSHVDQTSLGPALVDSIRISAPQCKGPEYASTRGLWSYLHYWSLRRKRHHRGGGTSTANDLDRKIRYSASCEKPNITGTVKSYLSIMKGMPREQSRPQDKTKARRTPMPPRRPSDAHRNLVISYCHAAPRRTRVPYQHCESNDLYRRRTSGLAGMAGDLRRGSAVNSGDGEDVHANLMSS